MIAAPTSGSEYRDPITGDRLTVGSVNEAENRITFGRWIGENPRIETTTITDFFERFMRPNLPDDSEV